MFLIRFGQRHLKVPDLMYLSHTTITTKHQKATEAM